MSKLHDTLTAAEKADLVDFLASYDAERNFLRENPYTPVFGQYTPSLIFTDAEDTAGQPDGYYFRAQGQEPPQEVEKQLYPIWGYLFAFIFIGGGLTLLWAFVSYFWPWVSACYQNMVCK
jgi:hypothetical protein